MSLFLESCFGRLRLRTGVLIIGGIHLGSTVVLLIMHLIMMISFFVGTSYSFNVRAAVVNYTSVIQGCILSYMLIAILLIYGAVKGNRHFMLPFLAVVASHCVGFSSYEIICCLFLVSTLSSLAIAFIYVGLHIFALVVVLSHHQELKKFTLHSREDDEVSIVNTA